MGNIVTFEPIQEAGTPTPSSPKPITAPITIDGIDDILYGGTIDLDTGILSKTWIGMTITRSGSWEYTDNQIYFKDSEVPLTWDTSGKDVKCDILKSVNKGSISKATYSITTYSITTIAIRLTSSIDTISKLREWIGEKNITVVNRITTPVIYQLTPSQLNQAIHQLGVKTPSAIELRNRIIIAQPHIENLSGSGIVTFETDVSANLKKCKIHFSPVQEGEGDPSPDNIRAITGWDEIDIGASNENLLPKEPPTEHVYKRTTGDTGGTWRSATNARACAVIPYPYEQTIHVQKLASDTSAANVNLGDTRILTVGTQYYANEGFTNQHDATFTNIGNCKYMNFYSSTLNMFNGMFGERQFMVSLGSTRKTYVAPEGTMHWVDFSDIGTVYGGYIDLVNGKATLTVTKGIKTINGGLVKHNSLANAFYANNTFTDAGDGDAISNLFNYSSKALAGLPLEHFGIDTNYTRLCVRTSAFSSKEEINEYLANTPLVIVYPLAVPLTYNLGSVETIKTLKGLNNIWSNANGNIDIAYWKH